MTVENDSKTNGQASKTTQTQKQNGTNGTSADQPSEAKPWSAYMTQIYLTKQPPSIGNFDAQALEDCAREATKNNPQAFTFVHGGAGAGRTVRANRDALDRWQIIPQMLRDATVRNLETTIFGVKRRSPICVGPVGVQGILHAEAELATARAAARVGVPFVMSTPSSRSPEQVAEACADGDRWFQMYWPRSEEITISLLSRIKASGFSVLVLTLDSPVLGFRPHDLATAYMPFSHGLGTQVGLSDPVFMARFGMAPRHERPPFPYDEAACQAALDAGDPVQTERTRLGFAWLGETNPGTFRGWEAMGWLRTRWEGPLVLKGVQSVGDAERAVEMGADGIVVSNHGGRQIDGAIGSFLALELIMRSQRVRDAQAAGKFTVFFDSGVRNGSDVLKAIAMGAQGVFVARPIMYGLSINGEQGVEEVLRGLLADTEITLGLSGYKNLDEIWGKREEFMIKV